MGDQEKALWKRFHWGCAFSNWTDAKLRSCREGAVKIRLLGC